MNAEKAIPNMPIGLTQSCARRHPSRWPLYSGLRRNEAKTLHWPDLVLGESGGLLRLHATVNKNRKEKSLPLHHELAKVLQQQRPAICKADDLVLVNGVPKMKEFRPDLKKAGIPFLYERGHRMDYHALRTTFITRLSTMKVHPRLAMELARHSDMRLTMKTYTDAGQLPLREVMDTLPSFGGGSGIDSRNLGATGQTVSPTVTKIRETQTENSVENIGESHRDSSLVTMSHEKSGWRREGDSNPQERGQVKCAAGRLLNVEFHPAGDIFSFSPPVRTKPLAKAEGWRQG